MADYGTQRIPLTRVVNTTAPLTGGGELSGDLTVAFVPVTTVDVSTIPGGTATFKASATTSTPTVIWAALSLGPSTQPAGYIEINIAGARRHIPYWA